MYQWGGEGTTGESVSLDAISLSSNTARRVPIFLFLRPQAALALVKKHRVVVDTVEVVDEVEMKNNFAFLL